MPHILVVGSAHIDAVAITEESLSDSRPDVEGRVSFSLGGTAFNIAKNLAQHELDVELLTSLKQGSITARLIEDHCKNFGVKLRTPIFQTESEGGFAGHFYEKKVHKAVCEAAIERVTAKQFDESFNNALRKASIVISDTNLRADQIHSILLVAPSAAKPVIISGVSVSRVKRLFDAVSDIPNRLGRLIDVLSVNLEEARALGIISCDSDTLIENPEEAISVGTLNSLRVRRLVISCGARGYIIYDLSDDRRPVVAHGIVNINPAEIKSDNGAGDAMVAAIAAVLSEPYPTWEDSIQRYVAPVLKVVAATTEDELGISSNRPKSNYQGAWFALAISLVSLVSIPVAGRIKDIGYSVTGTDVAFALAAILGLSAGNVGGKMRDLAAQLGFIEATSYVSVATSIFPAIAGLFSLFLFFVIPGFVNGAQEAGLFAPSHYVSTLWFCIALIGGYFTDLVVRQRLQLRHLKQLVDDD